MADDDLSTVVVDAEREPAPETVAEQAPRTVEDFARERGWKTKDELPEGAEWRSAEEFLAFGLDRTRDLSRDVKQLRDTTERMSRTQAEIVQQAAERARAEERTRLESVHRQAVEQGDHATAFEAVERIAELKQPAAMQPNLPPEVVQFQQANPWLGSDVEATALAQAVSAKLAAQGATVADQLQAAKEAVHKRFPEHAPATAKAPAAVNAPGARVADTRPKRVKGFNDMPADAQTACRELVKRGYTTPDGYAKQYWGQGDDA